MREQALVQAPLGTGSDILVRQGMRSWMEAGGQEGIAPATLAPPKSLPRPDPDLQPIAVMLASLLVWQAERSYYDGLRKA